MMNELEQKRMQKLQDALIKTALDLLAIGGAPCMRVTIPNTDPPVYIMVGEIKDIKLLVG